MQSRPTVLASVVLALALLGDSLLYAVLPLHASTFGISLPWVGVLLSANRIIRLFTYPFLARAAANFGLRRFTIAAATAGGLTTLAFALGSGGGSLLVVRALWGMAFGCLSLATLAYATQSSEGAGSRVGLSLSLRELGPVVSLTAGPFLVTLLGVRPGLAIVGGLSMLAVPVALQLPDVPVQRNSDHVPRGDRRFVPRRHETRSLVLGLVADGIFPASAALLLAPSLGIGGAAIAAGMLLALKRAAVIVLSPAAGYVTDRWNPGAATIAGIAATAGGALLIASNQIAAGSAFLVSGSAVASATIPLCITSSDAQERLAGHARIGVARDAGAAAGPLMAMAFFDTAGTTGLYFVAALMLLASVSCGGTAGGVGPIDAFRAHQPNTHGG